MDTTLVDKLLSRQTRMEQERSRFDVTWQDIAQRILPRKATFIRNKSGPNQLKGQKQTEKIFDAVPALALDRFAAAVHSLVVPRNQVWHKLRAEDEEINEASGVKRYFERVNKILFAKRYAGRSNFDNQAHECFYDLGAFATMVMYIGKIGQNQFYRSVPLAQAYFAENAYGVVDLMHRKYPMTARNAVKEFALDRLPDAIKRAANDNPEREFEFLHVCQPSEDMDVTRRDFRGMPYRQVEICIDTRTLVEESGYKAFPYAVSRYSATPGEVYGRGPAELVLPDVKMLNEMNKTTLQGAQLKVLPPMLTHRDGLLDGLRLTPGALNPGGVNAQGQALAHALETKGDIGLGLDMMNQKRKVIQDAFWNTLFQILVETPSMTATEAMLRAPEKGALLGPTAARIEAEFLATIIHAELTHLDDFSQLPDLPEEMIEAGAGYGIDYESPMAKARRAEEGVAMLRTWEQLATPAQVVGPSVYRRFNFDKSAQILAEVNGYPASAVYSDDELEQIKEDERQQQDMAAMLQAAPVAASAAKDLASAGAIAGAQPNQQFSAPAPA